MCCRGCRCVAGVSATGLNNLKSGSVVGTWPTILFGSMIQYNERCEAVASTRCAVVQSSHHNYRRREESEAGPLASLRCRSRRLQCPPVTARARRWGSSDVLAPAATVVTGVFHETSGGLEC